VNGFPVYLCRQAKRWWFACFLRCQKKREEACASNNRLGKTLSCIGIDERLDIVSQKTRIGDWEGDTIIAKGHNSAIVLLVERKPIHCA